METCLQWVMFATGDVRSCQSQALCVAGLDDAGEAEVSPSSDRVYDGGEALKHTTLTPRNHLGKHLLHTQPGQVATMAVDNRLPQLPKCDAWQLLWPLWPQKGRGGGKLSPKAGWRGAPVQGGRVITVSSTQHQTAYLSHIASIVISLRETPQALCCLCRITEC